MNGNRIHFDSAIKMSEKIEKIGASAQIPNNEEPNGEPTCKINFENNPNRVYYTGQVVSGCVQLSINETTTVRGKRKIHIFLH